MRTGTAVTLAAVLLGAPGGATLRAQTLASATTTTTAAAKPFAVEYYNKARWGSFDEFKALFRKNHYPVLLKEQALGRIVRLAVDSPINHGTEDGRWDMRVTIVWKDAATAHDDFDNASIVKELYPDQAAFRKEEQHRFELLLAHWDLPISAEDLSAWR